MILHGQNTVAPGILYLDIDVDNGDATVYSVIEILDIGTVTIGSDDDKDLSLFPNKISLRILFNMSVSEVEFIGYINEIYNHVTLVKIIIELPNHTEYDFQTTIEKTSFKSNIIDKTFEFSATDDFIKLKDFDPRTNPLGLNLNQRSRIYYYDYSGASLIEKILSLVNILPNKISVSNNIQARMLYDSNIYWVSFYYFLINNSFHFSPDSYFTDMISLLKQLLLNYNMTGYVDLYRNFKVIDRYIATTSPVIIPLTSVLGDYTFNILKPVTKISYDLFMNGAPPSSNYTEGTGDDIESLALLQPCGWNPENTFSSMHLWLYNVYTNSEEDVFWSQNDKPFRYVHPDGTFSPSYYLYEFPVNLIKSYLGKDKYQIVISLTGLDYDLGGIYRLPFFGTMDFKANKIEYDIIKNRSKLWLRSAYSSLQINGSGPEPANPPTNSPGYKYEYHVINEVIIAITGVTAYTLNNNYQFNSLEVFRNGQKQTKDVDYTETSNVVFTFLVPVTSDEKISVNYYIL